jgi:hypothetical protein
VNHLLNRNTFQAHPVLLNEGEHFKHGLALRTVRGAGRSLPLTENMQGFVNHFLDGAEVAGFELVLNDLFLLRRQIDIHRLRLH